MPNLEPIWSYQLVAISGKGITVGALMTAVLILIATFIITSLVQRSIRLGFRARHVDDEGTIGLVTKLVGYIIIIIGLASALSAVGINFGALFAAGAVFAVGVGFAMQTIMQNFVSGVILMLERSIKIGDVLDVDGELLRVLSMGVRSTVAIGLDGESVLIPNSILVQTKVHNRSHRKTGYRVRVPVGVSYDSDMDEVFRVLKRVGDDLTNEGPSPQVILIEFASSSVNFELCVWTTEPFNERVVRSHANKAVWDAFAEAGIVIAFPQLDVHFDGAFTDSLRKVS